MKEGQIDIKIFVRNVNSKNACSCQASLGRTTFTLVFGIWFIIDIMYS